MYDEDGGDGQKPAILGWESHHKKQSLKKNKNLRKDSRKSSRIEGERRWISGNFKNTKKEILLQKE